MRSATPNSTSASPADTAATARSSNSASRQLVLAQGLDTWLPVATGTVITGVGTVVNVGPPQIRMFGLLKRFILQMELVVTAPGGQDQTLGPFGPAAALDQVTLYDTNNYLRHNTSATHLFLVSAAKRRRVFGAAFTSDTPFGYGNNFSNVMAAPATIVGGASGTVNLSLEIPICYTDHDLRGAIWLGLTQASMNLGFRLNPNMFANSGTADATGALYVSAGVTNATLTSCTWKLYQNTIDQVPRIPSGSANAGAPILPWQDIGTNYMLQTSPFAAIVANVDNPFPYPNFRDIMSTMAIYDNAGVLNTGSDVNQWSIQTANTVNILQIDPKMSALMTRGILGDDVPPGMYYFDHRHRPIYTQQYGNMALLLNPSSVGAASSLTIGLEMLAIAGVITGAGSLAGT